MKRSLKDLARQHYDVVIVGGGIYGACIAWDAALRGLLVCLVEKSDFGSGTSANSLKIIHGGLRHIQHGNLAAMRELICERRTWMKIAPHLIHPLPILVPTYNRWLQKMLVAALALNDLIGADRNRIDDPQKHIPRGKALSKSECLEIVPDIPVAELTGAIVFHDAQVYNTERLLLSFLRSAANSGADLANYVEATGLLTRANRVLGVQVRDLATGDRFDIQGKTVVSACGPWLNDLLRRDNGSNSGYAKAINVVTRPRLQKYALGIAGRNGYKHSNSLLATRTPLLFVTPWRNRCLIGTRYMPYEGKPDELNITERDVLTFLDDINLSWPAAKLQREDVTFVHGGLLPAAGKSSKYQVVLSNKYQIVDHRAENKAGLISVMSNKYTTARVAAEKVVDAIFSTHKKPPRSRTSAMPLHGGAIEGFDTFVGSEVQRQPHGLSEKTLRRLLYNYGSAYSEVLRYLDRENQEADDEDLIVLRAETLHAVRDEMAHKLSDVVFRRTEVGSAGDPGFEALRTCAKVMSTELGWSPERTRQEIAETRQAFNFGGCHSIST